MLPRLKSKNMFAPLPTPVGLNYYLHETYASRFYIYSVDRIHQELYGESVVTTIEKDRANKNLSRGRPEKQWRVCQEIERRARMLEYLAPIDLERVELLPIDEQAVDLYLMYKVLKPTITNIKEKLVILEDEIKTQWRYQSLLLAKSTSQEEKQEKWRDLEKIVYNLVENFSFDLSLAAYKCEKRVMKHK